VTPARFLRGILSTFRHPPWPFLSPHVAVGSPHVSPHVSPQGSDGVRAAVNGDTENLPPQLRRHESSFRRPARHGKVTPHVASCANGTGDRALARSSDPRRGADSPHVSRGDRPRARRRRGHSRRTDTPALATRGRGALSIGACDTSGGAHSSGERVQSRPHGAGSAGRAPDARSRGPRTDAARLVARASLCRRAARLRPSARRPAHTRRRARSLSPASP